MPKKKLLFTTIKSTFLKKEQESPSFLENEYMYEIFYCKKCDFATYYVSQYKAHLTRYHGGMKGMFTCTKCKYIAPCEEYVKEHALAAHTGEATKTRPKKLKKAIMKDTLHSIKSKRVQNKARKIKLNRYKSKLGCKRDEDSKLNCQECAFSTATLYRLKKHISNAHGYTDVYPCTLCEYKAASEYYLKIHQNKEHHTKHTSKGTYRCRECKYFTNCTDMLKKHATKVHGQSRFYPCTLCKYMAETAFLLKKHSKKVHAKKFQATSSIKKSEANRKMCRAKKAKIVVQKKREYKTKSVFRCNECSYSASMKTAVEEHNRAIHFKQKDYFCKICKFETGWRASLHKHIKKQHKYTISEYYEKNEYFSTKPQFLRCRKSNSKFKQLPKLKNGYNEGKVPIQHLQDVKVIPLLSKSTLKDTTSNEKVCPEMNENNYDSSDEYNETEYVTPNLEHVDSNDNSLNVQAVDVTAVSEVQYQITDLSMDLKKNAKCNKSANLLFLIQEEKVKNTELRGLLEEQKQKTALLGTELKEKEVLLKAKEILLVKEKETAAETLILLHREKEKSAKLSIQLKEKEKLLETKKDLFDVIKNQINGLQL